MLRSIHNALLAKPRNELQIGQLETYLVPNPKQRDICHVDCHVDLKQHERF